MSVVCGLLLCLHVCSLQSISLPDSFIKLHLDAPCDLQSFFTRWWDEQTEDNQETVKKLVADGRLNFLNGGWVQHDEAASHYVAMIDQTSRGHR